MITQRKEIDIGDCQAVIMATHDEYMHIWTRVAHESPWRDASLTYQPRRILWEQQCTGKQQTIGKIGKFPLVLTMLFAWLDGEPIAFVSFCSRISDSQAAEEWIKANAAPGVNIADAMNWSNALRRV